MALPLMALPALYQYDITLRLGSLSRQVDLASRNGDVRSLGELALELLALKSSAEHRLKTAKDSRSREQAQRVLAGVTALEDRVATLYVLKKVRNRVVHNPMLLGAATKATTTGP